MHFFNPVDKMPLVEIVRGPQTSEDVVAKVAAVCSITGKFPIVVADVPGFLVNRILAPYLNEALILFQEGVGEKDIDRAAQKFGMPMGPIRLLDEVGLDVAAKVSESLFKAYGTRFASPDFSKRLVSAGRIGKKAGKGFYDYKEGKAEVFPELRKTLGLPAGKRKLSPELIAERLAMSLLSEGIRCLDEGVAGPVGAKAANQIDLGTVMGMGFPAFRGGLIRYAEELGAHGVRERLTFLTAVAGKRFQPPEGVLKRAFGNWGFYDSPPSNTSASGDSRRSSNG
jgi:3-hydroxyacyl-CoA dehydrogenase/enoyl-CoA hydratase/3-hydroxybutyryl-CoA epimerase